MRQTSPSAARAWGSIVSHGRPSIAAMTRARRSAGDCWDAARWVTGLEIGIWVSTRRDHRPGDEAQRLLVHPRIAPRLSELRAPVPLGDAGPGIAVELAAALVRESPASDGLAQRMERGRRRAAAKEVPSLGLRPFPWPKSSLAAGHREREKPLCQPPAF